MINILLVRRNKNFIKLKVYGHSGYDEIGKDIVCASVSTLAQSVIIGLDKVVNNNFIYTINQEDASLYVDISGYDEESLDRAQILIRTFKYTVDSLLLDYKKYIKLIVKEEQ